jgi:NitT/TauT family transport system substrate-binding protein
MTPIPFGHRQMSRRLFVSSLACGAVGLAATACGGGNSAATGSNGAAKVGLGMITVAGYAGIYIAMTDGYFKDANIEVEHTKLRTPADLVPNLLNGKVQMGGLNPGNLSQAMAQGLDLKIIGVVYMANDDMTIFSLKNSGITTPKDLEGKKVGLIQFQNTLHASLLEIMHREGVDADKVEFVLVPITEMPAALRSGQVDAGHVIYPLAAQMASETTVVVPNMLAPLGPNPIMGYEVVTAKYATQNPDVVARLRGALEKGNDTAATNKDALLQAIHTITGAPVELLQNSKLPAFGNDLKLEDSQQQLELMTKYGFLKDPINLRDYVLQT